MAPRLRHDIVEIGEGAEVAMAVVRRVSAPPLTPETRAALAKIGAARSPGPGVIFTSLSNDECYFWHFISSPMRNFEGAFN